MDISEALKQRCKPFKNQKKIVNIVAFTPQGFKSSFIEIKDKNSIDTTKQRR